MSTVLYRTCRINAYKLMRKINNKQKIFITKQSKRENFIPSLELRQNFKKEK